MNLNINRIKIIIATTVAFFLCSAMNSKCNIVGPATKVNGVVTDGVTGKPIGNLPMKISSLNNSDPHYVNTNSDGSYYIEFNAVILTNYYVSIGSPVANNYVIPDQISITQGINNVVNYIANPAVNVTVNLVNHSNYGQNFFQLTTLDSINFGKSNLNVLVLKDQNIIADTIVKYKLAHYSHVSFESDFVANDGTTTKSIKQNYILGNKDTLININNP